VRWPDFGLPLNWPDAYDAFGEVWHRAAVSRVEVACGGGRGRTGTALACLAVLDGLAAAEAIGYVRARYAASAVETPWQRWFVGRFARRCR
jgi:protein-tyrosine phosphatase